MDLAVPSGLSKVIVDCPLVVFVVAVVANNGADERTAR